MLAVIVLSLFAVLLGPPVAQAAPAVEGQGKVDVGEVTTYDQWFTMLLSGKSAGWTRRWATRDEERGTISTFTDSNITIKRGRAAITIAVQTRFLETIDGKPIEAQTTQQFGTLAAMNTTQVMKFDGDTIHLTSLQGGQKLDKQFPMPEEKWRPPAATERYIKAQLAEGADLIECSTMDASMGPKVITVQQRLVGEGEVEVMGKVVPAIKWQVTMSNAPGITVTEYATKEGDTLKTDMTLMPGVTMTMIASDQQLATSKVDPPELLVSTMVEPNKPIGNARKLRMGEYLLKLKKDANDPNAASPSLPSTGYQQVLKQTDDTVHVRIDLDKPVMSDDDKPTDDHLRSSLMLNHKDPAIVKLTKDALATVAKDAGPADKAERLRRFVDGYIDAKDLDVGFATASEVAATKKGDCSEHAVLLAAMLRAAGIPSRTASGMLYVDEFAGAKNVFGYHMWTQAWIDPDGKGDRWVDLDPVLGDRGPYDATHITLGVNARTEGSMSNDIVAMLPVLGRVSIEVKDLRH